MTLRQFIDLFASPSLRAQLEKFARRPDVKALIAVRKSDGTLSASAFTDVPEQWPPSVEHVWLKPSSNHSRTQHALSLVAKGMAVKDAATEAKVSTVAIYRALKRREGKPVCQCCGQVIHKAFRNPSPPEGDA